MLSPPPILFLLLCVFFIYLPLTVFFTVTSPYLHHSTTNTSATTFPPNKTDLNPPSPPLHNTPPLLKTLINNTVFSSQYGNSGVEEVADEEDALFRLASPVNPNPKSIKKLAFMFLTTTSPLPFAPLWEMFFNNTPKNLYNIYIHADPTSTYKASSFVGVFSGRVIPSIPTRRNTPTLAAAERRLIAYALIHDTSNYMFYLLSPNCIPLHSFNFTYQTLTSSTKSFIEIHVDDSPEGYNRWAVRGDKVMLPEVRFDDFRIGSQFFGLKREHATLVAHETTLWSKFKLPCVTKTPCYPEENYFPILLNMVDPRGCIPATLTHVDWSRSRGGHPTTYRKEEVSPELIQGIRRKRPKYGQGGPNGSVWSVENRKDPFLFARKFSPTSIEPLMRIANDVIFME